MRTHYEINTLAPLLLFQASWPLLQASPTASPKFVVVSSAAGSLAGVESNPFCLTAYATSKAAVNMVVKQISWSCKDKGLCAFVLHPGWVQTDMGNSAASMAGLEEAPVTVRESVEGLVAVVGLVEILMCTFGGVRVVLTFIVCRSTEPQEKRRLDSS
jgi:norsolorinic acid ketoreductase